jgi:cytochrome b involved in lipid metabolism
MKYTWSQVKEHSTAEDAWVVYQNKVYDVSDWYEHPGGAVIFTHAGDDMTDIFAAFHAAGSHMAMRRFYIGELDTTSVTHKDEQQIAFEGGYRRLRSKLIQMGMFKSSKVSARKAALKRLHDTPSNENNATFLTPFLIPSFSTSTSVLSTCPCGPAPA